LSITNKAPVPPTSVLVNNISTTTMPRKRRIDIKEEGEEVPGASQAKRKRKILNYDPLCSSQHEIIHELYDTIRNHKTQDGRLLCEAFIRVPKRRTASDYYEVVSTPIDLLKIQQKVKTDSYDYVDQLSADIMLMVNNAKAYYQKTSSEYKDACDLMELYELTRAELVEAVFGSGERRERRAPLPQDIPDLPGDPDGDDDDESDEEMDEEASDDEDESGDPSERGSSVGEDLSAELEQLFAAIVTTKDGDRDISQAFQLLPLKAKFPAYYVVIKRPIDLKTIATKIQEAGYISLDALEADLQLMVKNAKTFNEPRSLIYRDAVTLQRVISERKRELEYKKTGSVKSNRLRTKDRAMPKMSAVCAALKYQSSDDEEEEDQFDMDEDVEAGVNGLEEDDPQWMLYNHVKNITDDRHNTLAEPFLKMPSKRFNPDYYHEIKKPMCINKIRSKIESNSYDTVMDVAQDFNLCFKNAKQYNDELSQIHKDAITLQQEMLHKLKDLDADLAEELLEEMENDNEEDSDEEEENTDATDDDDSRQSTSISTNTTPSGRGRGRGRGGRRSSLVSPDGVKIDRRRSEYRRSAGGEDSLKKRLRGLFTSVYDYCDVNGRLLRPIFMALPSRKDYPDYYQVIMEPMDLSMIQEKLKSEKYANEQAILSDFEQMFNNARHYNEVGSQVWQDANTLSKALSGKWKYMSSQAKLPGSRGKSKVTEASPLSQKLHDLYDSVRDFQDRSGRVLSTPFIKVPNKAEYPDYYEVIKRPMDVQTIQGKMTMTKYLDLEDMVTDFVLLFDNACKYNEPESVIYRDALCLQRVCLQKKLELMASCDQVPEVRGLTLDLMKSLFVSTFNYQVARSKARKTVKVPIKTKPNDEEGRCYSDSFTELVEKDKEQQLNGEVDEAPLTFDQIRKNLDKGRYRRLDRFQEDMFKVFERARELSRLDSQLYEDAVEMQKYFVRQRDELCKNGEMLLTPALSYTPGILEKVIEGEAKDKAEQEKELKQEEEEKAKEAEQESSNGRASSEDVEFKGQVYTRGDYVYIAGRDSPDPHILVIESFSRDAASQVLIKGQWFFRPAETYHLATRKFLEKEVFLSDTSRGNVALTEIVGRCCVMNVKDYFKSKPEGIHDKDVFVCESRYITKHRCFKKIKSWRTPVSKNFNIVPRGIPLVPIRVASMFSNQADGDNALDDSDTVIDKKRESVKSEADTKEGCIYYDQYVASNGCFKLGDGVYISNPAGQPHIARIDKIWTDSMGEAFFHYAAFLRPSEVDHAPNRLFFRQEVFQAALEDCALIKNIVGKCCVLHIKDYCSSRATEIPETDVYLNESKIQELDKLIKKQFKLKRYVMSPKVVDDEIFFFRKPIAVEKVASPLLLKADVSLFVDTEDSNQGTTPDASNDGITLPSTDSPIPPPTKSGKKQKSLARRLPSGYIVFAGETRKQILKECPQESFGEISKMVGNRWRNLSKLERASYEEKAKEMSEVITAKYNQEEALKRANQLSEDTRSQSPWNSSTGAPSTPGHPNGFPGSGAPQGFYHGSPMHPGLPTGASPPAYPHHRGPHLHGHPGMHVNGMHAAHNGIPPPLADPMFVSVPPRNNKLMHSEVYLRYIEGLNTSTPHLSQWERQMAATQATAPAPTEASLPGHWLAQGAGCHGSVTNALWALRDMMLKDAVGLYRTVPFDDL